MTSLAGAGPFAGQSIAELAGRLRNGGTTARTLAESALAAATEFGPALNCYVTVDNDGALRAAERADRELADGHDRGPLHGIPVAVKDLIDTEGLRTTRGSWHFGYHVPKADAAVVTALRTAGAVIVGKTHTHQFAYGPTGDVAHNGPARNPYDQTRMTGGSSSGSAAAVAAGLVPAALGTDTGGSVRIPAALCGIVGLRPTQGTLPGTGVFPLSASLDSVGPMAATVADTALLFDALTGHRTPAASITGLRVGVVRSDETEQIVPAQAEALERALAALRSAGFVINETWISDLADHNMLYRNIQGPEARAVHADRVANAPEGFEPEILVRLAQAAEVPGWEYISAMRERAQERDYFPQRVDMDLLVLPTVPIEAPPIGARDIDLGADYTNPVTALLALNAPWSVLGVPAISVPVPGAGLPGSVQLVGRAGGDAHVLAAAATLAAHL
ncbi:MAG TPA: amidase [Pseudonocardiaceae bacterium]|nr:amidase [Pseudonocardiaceae bacterium]